MAKQDLTQNAGTLPVVSDGEYSQVVEAAELGQVRLIGCIFTTLPEAFGPPTDDWRSTYSCNVTEAFFDDEVGLLTGWVVGKVVIKSGRRKILDIKATYLVIYDISGNPTEDAALKFVRTIGNFAVYPYFRSHFASVTSDAGLKLPPLPILKEGRRRIQAFLPEENDR
jgi:hypothetical protein